MTKNQVLIADVNDAVEYTAEESLPPNWTYSPLGSIAHIRGDTIDPEKRPDLKYVGLEHIDSGSILIKRCGSPQTVRSAKSLFLRGDVLYGKLRPYLDKAVLAPWDGMCSTDILVIAASENVDTEYLAHLVHTTKFREFAVSTTTGVNHPRTSWHALEKSLVALPPLSEQRAIAHTLRTVQQAKEATEAVITATRELKKSMMRHLFTYGPVPVDQAEQVPLKETEIGRVPEHWTMSTLGAVARIGNGSTPKRDRDEYWAGGTIPWLTSGKVHETRIKHADEFVTETALEECHLPLVPAGNLVMAITGQGKTLGTPALIELDTCVNQHLAYIRFNGADVLPEYVLAYLQTKYEDLRSLGSAGGSTKGALTCGLLKSYALPVPPPSEQVEIARTVSTLDAKLGSETDRLSALDSLFQSFLHHLMTGKIRAAIVDSHSLQEEVVHAVS